MDNDQVYTTSLRLYKKRPVHAQAYRCLKNYNTDEMDIAEIGAGVDGDKNRKTVLFCVIPDSDKSYSFLVGMLYSQIYQELYYQADFIFRGRLPIHVTFLLDEFAVRS